MEGVNGGGKYDGLIPVWRRYVPSGGGGGEGETGLNPWEERRGEEEREERMKWERGRRRRKRKRKEEMREKRKASYLYGREGLDDREAKNIVMKEKKKKRRAKKKEEKHNISLEEREGEKKEKI